jgi:uncharacterized repeat protein (TIGR02543 family)
MNKKMVKFLATLTCSIVTAVSLAAFAGCGDNSTSSGGTGTNTNQTETGKENDKENNNGNSTDTTPTTTKYKVTFNYNYEGSADATSIEVESGTRATEPEDPTREGYVFEAWYTTATCDEGTEFAFTAVVSSDVTLYAKWNEVTTSGDESGEEKVYTQYTFEAECVDFSDFEGAGLSGGAQLKGAILADWYGEANASGQYYVSFLYVNSESTTLTFVINSDREVDDATLILRLSGEAINTVSFTDEEWQVVVNGESIKYGSISINGCLQSGNDDYVKPFINKRITTTLHLNEGENIIQLKTTNNKVMTGTMYATAPMVDCMYITTDAVLTWDPIENKKPFDYKTR